MTSPASVLSALAQTLYAEQPVPRPLLEVLTRGLMDLLPASGAVVALVGVPPLPGPVVGTDGVVVRLLNLQETLEQGPVVDAARTRRPVVVLPADQAIRYPLLSAATRDLPHGTVASFPLFSGPRLRGTLLLTGLPPGGLGPEEVATVALLVAATAAHLHDVEVRAAHAELVAAVSHELRAPMTNISGFVELLQDGDAGGMNPAQDGFVEAIGRSGERLQSLADELLTMSALDSRPEAALTHAEVDLGKVVCDAQFALERSIARRDVEVVFDLPPQPVVVRGDAAHLESLVVNLMGNALKFTPDGGWVRCRLAARGPMANLTVSDNGLGIPQDEQDQLFTRFFRSSTAREARVQGTGLGLSIVAGIVAEHGGQIAVTSAHLAGSSFSVDLPLLAVDH